MPLDLRSFLDGVGDAIYRPNRPVSTVHEVTALQHALQERGRFPVIEIAAPLLNDGRTSDIPLVTNLSASRELTAAALGFPSHRQAAKSYADRAAKGIEPITVARGDAPVQAVVLEGEAASLFDLPACVQHHLDPGPYLTAAHATTRDPDSGIDNTAIQRCWIKEPRRMSYFPYPRSHNAANMRKYWAKGEAMPVAFWIGHHPAVLMGSQAKLKYPESHWSSAGALAGEAVRLVPTVTHGEAVLVPADAEIVIEGFVPPDVLEVDGPFGEYTSYVGPQVLAAVCEVSAITRRKAALYHDYGSGLADALVPDNMVNEGKIYANVKRIAPSLANVHVPVSGRRFHAHLQFDNPARGEARDALMAALADRRVKAAIALDSDVDIFDEQDVLWAVATRVQWHRDSWVVPGLSGSMLDPSIPKGSNTTSKIAIDATQPPAGKPGAPHPVPPRSEVPKAAMAKARDMLNGAAGGAWPAA
jgi:2,5-furandicarboxylate decarboxylase 1